MIAVGALLALAAVIVLGAPLLLRGRTWPQAHPRLALRLWLAAFTGGLTAGAASLAVALATAASVHTADAPVEGVEPAAVIVYCWVGLGSVGGLAALVVVRAEPLGASARELRERFALLAAAGRPRPTALRGVDVVVVESDAPVAIGLDLHGERRIVVSTALERLLSPIEVRAVLEHERAHLVGRHGRLQQLAALNLSCLPALAGARRLERAVRLLVELVADDEAARIVGAEPAASALRRVGEATGSATMLLRADRLGSRPPARPVERPLRRPAAQPD